MWRSLSRNVAPIEAQSVDLGHALQLVHVADGTDSCMTTTQGRIDPSASAAANALSFVPDAAGAAVFQNDDERYMKKAMRDTKKKHENKRKKRKERTSKTKSRDGAQKLTRDTLPAKERNLGTMDLSRLK
jgi:hypothetical protein